MGGQQRGCCEGRAGIRKQGPRICSRGRAEAPPPGVGRAKSPGASVIIAAQQGGVMTAATPRNWDGIANRHSSPFTPTPASPAGPRYRPRASARRCAAPFRLEFAVELAHISDLIPQLVLNQNIRVLVADLPGRSSALAPSVAARPVSGRRLPAAAGASLLLHLRRACCW